MQSMVKGLHFCCTFLTSGHSKCFTILPNIHTPTAVSAKQGDSQLVRSRQIEASHSETPRAGDRTSNLPNTSRHALPPETHAASRQDVWVGNLSQGHYRLLVMGIKSISLHLGVSQVQCAIQGHSYVPRPNFPGFHVPQMLRAHNSNLRKDPMFRGSFVPRFYVVAL